MVKTSIFSEQQENFSLLVKVHFQFSSFGRELAAHLSMCPQLTIWKTKAALITEMALFSFSGHCWIIWVLYLGHWVVLCDCRFRTVTALTAFLKAHRSLRCHFFFLGEQSTINVCIVSPLLSSLWVSLSNIISNCARSTNDPEKCFAHSKSSVKVSRVA